MQQLTHAVRQPHLGLILQMPIDISGRTDVAVSQPFADFFKLKAPGEQQTGTGVTQIMEPDIRHGDMVLVNQAQTRIFGHAIYAVGVNEEIYIKQIETLPGGRLVLRSLNRNYAPIEVNLQEDIQKRIW